MSTAHAVPAPDAPAKEGERTRGSLARWIGGGAAAATAITVVAIAAWPASAADRARSDGEQLGAAVSSLTTAESSQEVDAALAGVRVAADDARAHAGDALAEQVEDQADALARAVDGFVGATASDDALEADLYEYELDVAVADLTSQADDFRAEGPAVQQAFWDGYQSTVEAR
jgi:hypothetical protein